MQDLQCCNNLKFKKKNKTLQNNKKVYKIYKKQLNQSGDLNNLFKWNNYLSIKKIATYSFNNLKTINLK